jgi:hypothetical protein
VRRHVRRPERQQALARAEAVVGTTGIVVYEARRLAAVAALNAAA